MLKGAPSENPLITHEQLLERPLKTGYAIDPPNPHEVDDAIRVEKITKNQWRIAVLIADGGLLADEAGVLESARDKGASLYDEEDPGFVEPMLPERISKQQLGLDAFSSAGVPAVEVSFTYDLEKRQHNEPQVEYVRATTELENYDSFMKRAQEDPDAAHLLSIGMYLNQPPGRLNTYEPGKVAYYTVGNYMVAANRVVAEDIFRGNSEWLFRNHGDQRTFDQWRDKKERAILTRLRYAAYGKVAIGHRELNLPKYCHFTSPLRRFPDLVNHVNLRRYLAGEDPVFSGEELHEITREQTAMMIQRNDELRAKLAA